MFITPWKHITHSGPRFLAGVLVTGEDPMETMYMPDPFIKPSKHSNWPFFTIYVVVLASSER
jgi:hypothetical protein